MPVILKRADSVLITNDVRFETVRAYANGIVFNDSSVAHLPSVYAVKIGKTYSCTPGFFSLKRSHEKLPDRGFSWIRETLPSGFVKLKTIYKRSSPPLAPFDVVSQTDTTYDWLCNYCRVQNTTPSLGQSKLRQKILDKAKGNQWNVPVFIAEGRKTIHMVEQAATKIVTGLVQLKRGNFLGFTKTFGLTGTARGANDFNRTFPRNRAKAVANAWLEHRYGWLPLMQDVHSAVDTLSDVHERSDAHLSRCVSRDKLTRDYIQKDFVVSVSPEIRCTLIQKIVEERKLVWKFEAKPINTVGKFGLLNPLEVAWELVPFSFVADWFVPIGAYLSSIGSGLRFSHAGGTSGYKCTTTCYYLGLRFHPSSGSDYTTSIDPGEGVSEHIIVTRDALTEIPDLRLSDLTFDASLSTTRMTSAIALLTQVFSKSK